MLHSYQEFQCSQKKRDPPSLGEHLLPVVDIALVLDIFAYDMEIKRQDKPGPLHVKKETEQSGEGRRSAILNYSRIKVNIYAILTRSK